LVLILLHKTTENQDSDMAAISADSKELLQMWFQLNGCAQPPCYGLQPTASQPATFQHLRFGMKFVLLSKIEIIDGGEWLNLSHGCSTHNIFPFFIVRLRL
jgi:hypothetical protein